MQTIMVKEIMNLAEASKFLGVCTKKLARIAKDGEIPCRKIGRKYLFHKQALLDYLVPTDKIYDKNTGGVRKEN